MKNLLCVFVLITSIFVLAAYSKPVVDNTVEPTQKPVIENIVTQTPEPKAEAIIFNDPILESKTREAVNKPDGLNLNFYF